MDYGQEMDLKMPGDKKKRLAPEIEILGEKNHFGILKSITV